MFISLYFCSYIYSGELFLQTYQESSRKLHKRFFFFFLVKYRPNSFSFFKMDKFLPLIILLFMYNQGLSVGIALIILLSVDNNMHQAYFREILHASVNLVPFLQNIL